MAQFGMILSGFFQALQKAGKPEEKSDGYVLVEEVHKGWDKKDRETGTQRILELGEKVLLAQNKWKGSGKFLLKKKCDVSVTEVSVGS